MNHTANGTSRVLFSWLAFKPASVWIGKLDVRALISKNGFACLPGGVPKICLSLTRDVSELQSSNETLGLEA